MTQTLSREHRRTLENTAAQARAQAEAGAGAGGFLRAGSASVTLTLRQSPAFRALPKADPAEVERRIAQLRADWGDDRGDN